MKKSILHVLSCLLLICSFEVKAQGLTDSTEISQTIWRMKQKRAILDYMNLSEAEKACFWPMYDSYMNSIEFIEAQSMEILAACSTQNDELSPREIGKLTAQLMQNDLWLAKIRKQFYRKLSKALSPSIAMRFLSLDDTVRQTLRLEVRADGNSSAPLHASMN